MPYRLGIDLGTTFTAAAICRPMPDGTVHSELMPLGRHASSVPSVLYLSGETLLVGEAAERRALTDPGCVVRDFKRRLGDDIPLMVDGRPQHAHDLAARLVDWVVERVTEREGEPPDAIAVTYPAAWGPHRSAVLRAALGEHVVLLTEPQAAAMRYASESRVEPGRTIAVYDLGGGTFDAVVVRKTDTGFELLGAPEGIERLGGIDFDEAVLDRVLQSVPPPDPADPDVLPAMVRLRRDCTEAKEALSDDTEATVPVLLPAIRTQVRLTRPEFEDMIRPVLVDTVRSLQRAVQSAGLTADEVDAVLLVGGSSRIPLVTSMISAELGRPVAVDADPKAVVALGAALAADQSVLTLTALPPRPERACTPPTLKRPRRRLRRTKIVLVTLVMFMLALAVIPSPFTSDSTPTPPADKADSAPAGTNAPAPAGAAPTDGNRDTPGGAGDPESAGSAGSPDSPAAGTTGRNGVVRQVGETSSAAPRPQSSDGAGNPPEPATSPPANTEGGPVSAATDTEQPPSPPPIVEQPPATSAPQPVSSPAATTPAAPTPAPALTSAPTGGTVPPTS
ncbi:MAG: Hsp70 family protein [Kibdelosporangium sp.]